jgi:hypothetical protein
MRLSLFFILIYIMFSLSSCSYGPSCDEQAEADIDSYQKCVDAGYEIEEHFGPNSCLTPCGQLYNEEFPLMEPEPTPAIEEQVANDNQTFSFSEEE